MATNCTPRYVGASIPTCCAGASGTVLTPFAGYYESPPVLMTIIYLLLLLWMFLGVALAADVFMAAIEQITSQLTFVKHVASDGTIKRFRVRSWNPTIANLTLMALGSSAPEILLSSLEILFNDLYSGDLGPSTIVGSAAFNLFVIIAVCVVSIPADDGRQIMQLNVYAITASVSVFAYAWLVVILMAWTPDIITILEAVLTLLFFPTLVFFAFLADKWGTDLKFKAKWSKRLGLVHEDKSAHMVAQTLLPSEMLLEVKNPDGTPLDPNELMSMIKRLRRTQQGMAMSEEKAVQQVYQQLASRQPKSRAFHRVAATRATLGGQKVTDKVTIPPTPGTKTRAKVAAEDPKMEVNYEIKPGHSIIEFAAESYAVIEAAGTVTVDVLRIGDTTKEVTFKYTTVDGTGKAGSDFELAAGEMTFAAGETEHGITIKIFDDDEIEPDETFFVELQEIVKGDAEVGPMAQTKVTIINDDFPGTFCLRDEELKVKECDGVAKVVVERKQGCSGEVSMKYKTMDGSALAGKNYHKTDGTLTWAHQDVQPKTIEVPIIDDDVMSGKLYLELEVFGAAGGAVFDEKTDGSKEKSLARITIIDDDAIKSIAERAIGLVGMNQQTVKLGASSWGDQFRALASPGGGDDDEEEDEGDGPPAPKAGPGVGAWIMHIFALPFKLLMAFVPPPSIGGGWPCFCLAVSVIGGMTALIGDLANLLGCSMGLKSEVVAFTFVALGTSLPDTFASRTAALGDATADNAVGNVTGSNAVNVFLGCGVAWVVGAIYWTLVGFNSDWLMRYPQIATKYNAGPTSLNLIPAGLAVPAGSLGLSVTIFCIEAVTCIAVLAIRRKMFGFELGSKMRWPTFALFVGLWLVYVGASTVIAYSQ